MYLNRRVFVMRSCMMNVQQTCSLLKFLAFFSIPFALLLHLAVQVIVLLSDSESSVL